MNDDATTQTVSARAAALHRDALVWDNHGCMPHTKCETFLPELERYRNGGVDVAVINLADADHDLESLMRLAATIRHYVKRNAAQFALVSTVRDILAARKAGRLAILFDIEGVYAIGDQLNLLELLFDLGVRWMSMVYNRRNLVGSGCHDDHDDGLTPFGLRVVEEMDRIGIIKCCTHTGYRTAREVIDASARPVIFSHSVPRGIRAHPRNIPDDLVMACAAGGGVVGINGIDIFLGDNDCSVDALVHAIDYTVQLAGPDHVGIGLDYVFDQQGMDDVLSANAHVWPADYGYHPGIRFFAPDDLPRLTDALLGRGYADDDVRAILGGNWMRVAEQVWPKHTSSRI